MKDKEQKAEYDKECRKNNKKLKAERDRIYREKNKEYLKEKSKQYYKDNKEYMLEKNKKYRESNKETISKQRKEYRETHKEHKSTYDKERRNINKDDIAAKYKEWYKINKESVLAYKKEWGKRNKEHCREHQKQYMKNRCKTDVNFRILCNYRGRIYKAIKENAKSECTTKIIGCTIEELKQHLENQFSEGMTFENYGKWHIDHVKPCSLFNLENEADQRECFNYKNLQPLWAIDNIIKSNKY